ncbi:hypothetical protein ACQKEN_06170 [Pseudomonas sp. NPDC078416]|uniref:hypothetical protein n=1 Tax=Pseudomonas sp. NPDC078416 TaxID=3390637 RepID=UPI003D015706
MITALPPFFDHSRHTLVIHRLPFAHITHRLLTAIETDREPPLDAQAEIKLFEEQMTKHGSTSPKDEYERNDLFLKMHKQIDAALEATVQAEGGIEALQRLDIVVSASRV